MALAVASFIFLAIFRDSVSAKFVPGGWSLGNLYSAIFNWAALQSGFIFSVYGFVVAKQDGFVAAARGTAFMAGFIKYNKRAIISGFILTLSSIPLLVINPELKPGDWGAFFALALWFSLFVWAFISFLRVAFIFGLIARVRDREEIPA
jgi:hypothetical protein